MNHLLRAKLPDYGGSVYSIFREAWYYQSAHGEVVGPVALTDIGVLIEATVITGATFIRHDRWRHWRVLSFAGSDVLAQLNGASSVERIYAQRRLDLRGTGRSGLALVHGALGPWLGHIMNISATGLYLAAPSAALAVGAQTQMTIMVEDIIPTSLVTCDVVRFGASTQKHAGYGLAFLDLSPIVAMELVAQAQKSARMRRQITGPRAASLGLRKMPLV